jgi:hypothetical protein
LADQFFNFSEKRLARVLVLFGEIIKESKPEHPLKVSQATLAEMVGTTRARVSKFMNGFKNKGFVHYNGGLQINSALIATFLQNRPMSVVTKRLSRGLLNTEFPDDALIDTSRNADGSIVLLFRFTLHDQDDLFVFKRRVISCRE